MSPHSMTSTESRKSMRPLQFWIRGIVAVILILSVVWLLSPFLIPLLIGAILAITTYPIYSFFLKSRWKPSWAAFTTSFLLLSFILLPVLALIIQGVTLSIGAIENFSEANEISSFNPTQIRSLLESSPLYVTVTSWLKSLGIPRLNLLSIILWIKPFVTTILSTFIKQIPQILVITLVSMATVYFLLLESKNLIHFFTEYRFLHRNNIDRFFSIISSACRRTIYSNVIVGVVQTILVALGVLLTQSGNVILIAFLTFIFSFIPVIGAAPVPFILGVVQFFTGHIGAGIGLVVTGILAGSIDNVIRPMLVSSREANVHPLIGFLGIFGGISLMGVVGIFFGPLLISLAYGCLPLFYQDLNQDRHK